MMAHNRRRGRPKQLRPETDSGTPELQHKRQQKETLEVLDALKLLLQLKDEDCAPAYRFRWLYSLKFGRPCAITTVFDTWEAPDPRPLSEQERAEKILEFNVLCGQLQAKNLLHHFMNVVIYNRLPARQAELAHISRIFTDALALIRAIRPASGIKAQHRNSQSLIFH